MTATSDMEARRLEALWSGQFGDAYVDRNRSAGATRRPFWQHILQEYRPRSALEVGCNVGANLQWVAAQASATFGIDVNRKALVQVRANVPAAHVVRASGRQLPFSDAQFDLVFTVGVLMHQAVETLPVVMHEIVRCSSRIVLCVEYFAEDLTEVVYRAQRGALFKRDFGMLYKQLFPAMTLRDTGFLPRADGWDDATYWVFEKPSADTHL